MDGRPERAQTNVRLVRRAQPRATRSHALRLTVTIVVVTVLRRARLFECESIRGSPWVSRVDRSPIARSPLSRSVSDGDILGAARHIGRAVPSSSPIATMPPLPACRYADEPAAHAAYDDWQRTIVDTTSRLPKGYVPPDLVPVSRAGLSGGGSVRRIAIADLKALVKAGAEGRGATRGRVGLPERGPAAKDVRGLGTHLRRSRGQTFQCARRTLGAPARDRHRLQGRGRRIPVDARHSRARGMRDGWRPTPGGSAGSRAIRAVRRHRPATARRPGTTATSDGTSPPRSTRRG